MYDDGVDMTKVMFGQNTVHVPCWMYVQDQGDDGGGGVVSFVGSSRVAADHPLRFGSNRTHQFVVGEVIVRPYLVVGTDALRGQGLGNLAVDNHDILRMLRGGEVLLGDPGMVWP